MKKLALGFMALAISFATIAQDGRKDGTKRDKANKEARHNGKGHGFENMNLTDAQGTQLKSINENYRNQMKALKADNSIGEDAKKERMKTLRTQHKTQLSAVLTPAQLQQWEAKKKDGKHKGKAKGKNK